MRESKKLKVAEEELKISGTNENVSIEQKESVLNPDETDDDAGSIQNSTVSHEQEGIQNSIETDQQEVEQSVKNEPPTVDKESHINEITDNLGKELTSQPNSTQPKSNFIFGSAFKNVSFSSVGGESIFDKPSSIFSDKKSVETDSDRSSASENEGVDSVDTEQDSFTGSSLKAICESSYVTGEENEETLVNCKVKLYAFNADDSEWKERGIGQAKLNKSLSQPASYRIVIRHEVTKIVLFNYRISSKTPISLGKTAKTIQISVPNMDGKIQIFLMRFSMQDKFDEMWEFLNNEILN